MEASSNNDQFTNLMKQSRLQIPFSDFEETVMSRIQQEAIKQHVIARDYKLSFVFFLVGTILGIVICSVMDMPANTTRIIFQTVFILGFLVYLQKHLHLLKEWKRLLK